MATGNVIAIRIRNRKQDRKSMIQQRTNGRVAQRITQIRGSNRALVLEMLRFHPQLSRAELARRSGLSEGAISRIAAELLEERFILEQGAEHSTGGRPATRLELDESYHRSIGVDIRRWETRVSLGTIRGTVLETRQFRTPSTASRTIAAISDAINALKPAAKGCRIHGVGVGVRGIVDHERGVLEVGTSKAWNQVSIKAPIEERTALPVFVENDVRAAALAQRYSSNVEIRNSRCMLLIRVDDGVGMAILIDGKIYRGIHRSAGEIGQMVIADSPGRGAQDRPGCLESLAAHAAIFNRYCVLANEFPVKKQATEGRIRKICRLAQEGDPAAIQAIRESMRYLGIGLANVIWGFNADVVVIDGVITEAWPLVVESIREQFPIGEEFRHFHNLVVRPCALGPDAGGAGTLSLPFESLFEIGEFPATPQFSSSSSH